MISLVEIYKTLFKENVEQQKLKFVKTLQQKLGSGEAFYHIYDDSYRYKGYINKKQDKLFVFGSFARRK